MKIKMSVEEFRALPKRMRTSFDGQAAIRERLKRLNIAFDEEVEFALPRKYRADFLLRHFRTLIEYQGATMVSKSGHVGLGIDRDAEKLNLAQCRGYKLLQFTKNMLKDGTLFEETILAVTGGGKPYKNGHQR